MTVNEHTEAFGQRPFHVGTVRGVRAFLLCCCSACAGDDITLLRPPPAHPGGALRSLGSQHDWTPGENVATCQPRWLAPEYEHRVVGGTGCTCGFYAYLSSGHNQVLRGAPHVLGIVEGYGVVTVGHLGFRASKAHLVALVWSDELAEEFSSLTDWAGRVSAFLGSFGVPVYPTIEDAIAAHPLTKPEDVGVEPPDETTAVDRVMQYAIAASRAGAIVTVQLQGLGIAASAAAAQMKAAQEAIAKAFEEGAKQRAGGRVFASGGLVLPSIRRGLAPTRAVVDEVDPASLSPLERKRRAAERAAEARRAAGLRGSGGFDRRGKRR